MRNGKIFIYAVLVFCFSQAVFAVEVFSALFSNDSRQDNPTSESNGFSSFLSLELFPHDVLYADLTADHYYPGIQIELAQMRDGTGPEFLQGEHYDENGQSRYPIKSDSEYMFMKMGFSQSVLRVSLPWLMDLQAEALIQAMFNTAFHKNGGMDNLGFDGVYFYGFVLDFGSRMQIRFGKHHFSGHYGDEMLYDYIGKTDSNGEPLLQEDLLEYTRHDSYLLGISINPLPGMRLYGEFELPEEGAWVRPFFHRPDAYYEHGGPGWWIDAWRKDHPYGEDYKAWRIQTGAEIRTSTLLTGNVFAACDIQLHQDGMSGQWGEGYSADNAWEWEYTLAVGKEFSTAASGLTPRVSLLYHVGRFPLLNYFYHREAYSALVFSLGS